MTPLLAAAFLCVQPAVTDGDTLKCQSGERVRIWGVNSPERSDLAGPAATRAMSRLITGKTLSCVIRGRPSHNRTVAQCFTPDGRDIAREMVRGGFAEDWPKFSRGEYSR